MNAGSQVKPRSRPLWRILGCSALLFFAAGALAQTPPQGSDLRGPADDTKNLRSEYDKLCQKMIRLAEKLRSTHPYYADKLEQAVQLGEKSLVREDIDRLVGLLEQGQKGLSLDKARKVDESIVELINFLEDRQDARDIEKKLKELRDSIQQLKSIQDEQRKNLKETKDLNTAQNEAAARMKEELKDLLENQKELRDETGADALSKLLSEVDAASQELDGLQKEQQSLRDETHAAARTAGKDAMDIGAAIDKLKSIAERQQQAHRALRENNMANQDLADTAARLDKLIEEQADLAKDTGEAASGPEGRLAEGLARRQAAALKEAEELAKRLSSMADSAGEKSPLAEADKAANEAAGEMDQAVSDFEDQSLGSANRAQERALDKLKKAREAVQAAAKELDRSSPALSADMAAQQEKLAGEAQEAAKSLERSAESAEGGNAAQAFKESGKSAQNAAGRMSEAAKSLSNGRQDDAQQRQESAMTALEDAIAGLERLRNQLFQKNQPELDRTAAKQQEVSDKTAKLGDKLRSMSAAPAAKSDPAASSSISRAASQTRQGERKMADARKQLGGANPQDAAKDQNSALDSLKAAKEELSRLRDKLAKAVENKEDLKGLKDKQKKLEEQAKALADKLAQSAKDAAEKGAGSESEGMQNAGSKSSSAAGEMAKAGGKMDQGDRQQAQQNQQQAEAELEKAIAELEKLAKRDPTQEEKYALERLARKQEEIEKKTRELKEQMEQMEKQKKAAESVGNAAEKMKSASSNMSGGQPNPQQAEQDEEEALKDLEEAMEDLAAAEREYNSLMQEQVLYQIENDLSKILGEQKKITEATVEADFEVKKLGGELSREMRIALNKLADGQGALAEGCDKLAKQLEEANASVFPWVLGTIADDMRLVQELLGEKYNRTDDYTQGVQRDIERKLKELIDALKRERQKRRKEQQDPGNPGGGGGGGGPLVPPIAELKMLRQMQLNLKRKTEEFVKANLKNPEAAKGLDPVQQMILRRLAAEQENLADKTRNFAESMRKMVQEGR
ncbi:MAG: hypothetical protein RDV41_09800 [Planctomycetota bacterium]|nr:hypothetical protein [Planctomycetota bacterium]